MSTGAPIARHRRHAHPHRHRSDLLDICQALLAQRAAIAAVLGRFGPSWRETRTAFNKLARIVREPS